MLIPVGISTKIPKFAIQSSTATISNRRLVPKWKIQTIDSITLIHFSTSLRISVTFICGSIYINKIHACIIEYILNYILNIRLQVFPTESLELYSIRHVATVYEGCKSLIGCNTRRKRKYAKLYKIPTFTISNEIQFGKIKLYKNIIKYKRIR